AGLHCPAAWIRQFVYEDSSPGMAALIGTIRAAQHAYKGVPKSAAVDQKNSDAYALYTAAALCRFPPDKKEWGIKLAVWQTFE
ncbi:MAG TPA: hypothetical protein DEB39_11490, partial [Planctomycetaceae bacterium]|nr:hypothetical protein [Planctomycetaceae bacterium]